MASIEEIEMARYYDEIEDDLRHLVKKYCRIMGWEVPDLDEQRARQLMLSSIRDALEKIGRG